MPSFTCQRCNQPLRVDESLSDMDASSAELLLAPLSSEEQYKIKQQENINNTIPNNNTNGITNYNVSRKYVHKQSSSQQRPGLPVSDSFVILSKSQLQPLTLHNTTTNNINISHRLKNEVHSSLSKTAITKAGTESTSLSTSPHKKLSNIIITKGDISNNINANNADNNNTHHDNNKNNNSSNSINDKDNNTMKVNTPLTTPTIAEFPDNSHTNPIGLDIPPSSPRNNNLSHRLKVANRLFDVMSSKSNIDHPMCQECTDLMLEYLERQLEDVGRERDSYLDFLKKMEHTLLPVNNNDDNNNNNNNENKNDEHQLKTEVDELIKKEKEAMELLKSMKKEQMELEKKYDELLLEEKQLAEEDETFWDECNGYQLQYQQFQNERDSVNLKYDHDVRLLERLKKIVVYNDAFFISQDGPFGTINGYRLGRLSSHPVEWNEINAAWGQTLLLLYTVANKLKFSFQSYRLVPMGSFSKVEKVDGDIVVAYELYGSGDYGLNRMLFLNRRFDHAMVAMLNCLKQLSDYVEQRDRSIRLPYRINKDKIGELSIRLQFNQDESWTKALKYLLINLRFIQAFTCKTTS